MPLSFWRSPFFLLGLAVLFWAGNIIVGRAAYPALPPAALSFWRWVCAVVIILPFSYRRVWAQRDLIISHWRMVLLFAALSIALYTLLFYVALANTTAINAATVNTALPIMIMLVAWLAGERAAGGQWVGVALALAGVLVIISGGSLHNLLVLELRSGDLWILASALCWALYSVLLRHRRPPLDGLVLLTVCAVLGCLMLLPFWLYELASGSQPIWNSATVATVLYVGIFPSLLSYHFWNRAVVSIGPNSAGVFLHLIPVLSIFLAWLFLDESLHGYHLVGVALTFSGVLLSSRLRG